MQEQSCSLAYIAEMERIFSIEMMITQPYFYSFIVNQLHCVTYARMEGRSTHPLVKDAGFLMFYASRVVLSTSVFIRIPKSIFKVLYAHSTMQDVEWAYSKIFIHYNIIMNFIRKMASL